MIEWITANSSDVIDILAKVIAACAAIAAITPSQVDNEILSKILGFVNFLGLNIGKATNADEG